MTDPYTFTSLIALQEPGTEQLAALEDAFALAKKEAIARLAALWEAEQAVINTEVFSIAEEITALNAKIIDFFALKIRDIVAKTPGTRREAAQAVKAYLQSYVGEDGDTAYDVLGPAWVREVFLLTWNQYNNETTTT